MSTPELLNKREKAKVKTRAAVTAAARAMFAELPYDQVTIRAVARKAGYSTGAIFANFADKEAMWREVMGTEPPVDSKLTRAAGALFGAAGDVVQSVVADDGRGEFVRIPIAAFDRLHAAYVQAVTGQVTDPASEGAAQAEAA